MHDTPKTPTIATLVDYVNGDSALRHPERDWTAADTLKNVVVNVKHPDGTVEPLAVGIEGHREVDMKRLGAQVEPAEVEPFSEDDFKKYPSLKKGYIGPGVLGANNESAIRYLLDPRIVDGTQWITGADQYNQHVLHLTAGRDFVGDGTIEAAEVLDGDTCPSCGSDVEIARGIEIAHIFQLGTKYAEALELTVRDENDQPVTPTMGSYGVGVSRCLAAIAEATLDNSGLCWPREIAPADVHVIIAGKDGSPQVPAAEELTTSLEAAGLRVLLDDRSKASLGVKFKDAELIGVPTIVVVGRGIADEENPTIEVKDRKSGEREDIALGSIVEHLVALCR